MSLPEYNFNGLQVLVKDQLPDNVNIKKVFADVNTLLPDHFFNLVDIVYVGHFDFFDEREVNALYMDDAIYVTNKQDDEDDMRDDIIHELAHAAEEKYKDLIYDDQQVENEYFAKMKRLKVTLDYEGHDVHVHEFYNLEYNPDFDNLLYKEIGYEKLDNLINGLFLSPYSITSLREYWSTGFEEYFLGDRLYLKTVCPYLYKKLSHLENEDILHEH